MSTRAVVDWNAPVDDFSRASTRAVIAPASDGGRWNASHVAAATSHVAAATIPPIERASDRSSVRAVVGSFKPPPSARSAVLSSRAVVDGDLQDAFVAITVVRPPGDELVAPSSNDGGANYDATSEPFAIDHASFATGPLLPSYSARHSAASPPGYVTSGSSLSIDASTALLGRGSRSALPTEARVQRSAGGRRSGAAVTFADASIGHANVPVVSRGHGGRGSQSAAATVGAPGSRGDVSAVPAAAGGRTMVRSALHGPNR